MENKDEIGENLDASVVEIPRTDPIIDLVQDEDELMNRMEEKGKKSEVIKSVNGTSMTNNIKPDEDLLSQNLQLTLIQLVKKNPCLYDRNHERYSDTEYKGRLWEEIANKMNKKRALVKRKFASLYQRFGNMYVMLQTPDFVKQGYPKKKFFCYEEMLFLKDKIDVELVRKRITQMIKNDNMPPTERVKKKPKAGDKGGPPSKTRKLSSSKPSQTFSRRPAGGPQIFQRRIEPWANMSMNRRIEPWENVSMNNFGPDRNMPPNPEPRQNFHMNDFGRDNCMPNFPNNMDSGPGGPGFRPDRPDYMMGDFRDNRMPDRMSQMDSQPNFGPNMNQMNDFPDFPRDMERFPNERMPPNESNRRNFDGNPPEINSITDTHIDFFFKSISQQVKNSKISDRDFLDLQSTMLSALTCKLDMYRK
ncbi:uncharacterized protein LOC132264947 [Phlebotomus argentipes]|uniref:uncharacterized protein LOC132264947 n=1 Tax=Phlebotomus argentipes TaxID=94469 RepID=UPI002892AA61|nr:uncharacterized protein LOC132264947 [Phlebotomus argentipes]